ncbi:MAG: DNA-binding protein WhiA [Bifidobacteriaceae bacterium]|jgi:DNA-binding protein WhiA|nr:DNA-binding protein WhiA [Bifidobacteriaceae bacterium]
MNYTQSAIDEITKIKIDDIEAQQIIVSVAMRINGELKTDDDNLIINIHSRSLQFAKNLAKYLKSAFNTQPHIISVKDASVNSGLEHLIVQVVSKDNTLIKKAGLTNRIGLPVVGLAKEIIFAEKHLLKQAVATIFICSGKITDPSRAGIIEITVPSTDIAMSLDGIFNKLNIETRTKSPRGIYKVTIKDKQDIVEFLNFTGAIKTAEEFNKAYIKIPKSKSRIYSNNTTDTNILRSRRASQIAIIKAKRALEILRNNNNIKSELIDAAKLRIKNPNVSLEKLGCLSQPPATKDAIASRLKRLNQIADKVAHKQNIPDTLQTMENSCKEL